MLFAIEYSLRTCLSLVYLVHSLTPLACVMTENFGNRSNDVSHLENTIEDYHCKIWPILTHYAYLFFVLVFFMLASVLSGHPRLILCL